MHNAKLFLLAVFSLTILVPFGSGLNKSSNAMALTEDLYPDMTTGGGVDYSQYDKFYKDDNFRENYYNYHKQQHQHQLQQPGYENNDYNTYETEKTTKYVNEMADYVEGKYQPYAKDNNYLKAQYSDFMKKIKCNNINSNLNGIDANIGTNDPLSSIGAESIQDDPSTNSFGNGYRNNDNFDVDCINNNDNIGPREPEGPQGSPGLQGPFYQVLSNVTDVNPDELGSVDISCDDGDFAISGSGRFLVAQGDNMRSIADLQLNDTSWTAELNFDGENNGGVQVFAICIDNPPLHTTTTTAAFISTFQQQPPDSPTISQTIENSPKLTVLEKQPENANTLKTMEKVTKLKTQWLSQLK
jgi:hypothetical protein